MRCLFDDHIQLPLRRHIICLASDAAPEARERQTHNHGFLHPWPSDTQTDKDRIGVYVDGLNDLILQVLNIESTKGGKRFDQKNKNKRRKTCTLPHAQLMKRFANFVGLLKYIRLTAKGLNDSVVLNIFLAEVSVT